MNNDTQAMNNDTRETIIVRETDRTRYFLEPDDWRSMEMVGALSADPRTFDELDRAWQRYRPDEALRDLAWVEFTGTPPSGPWVILDLACQRVVSGGGGTVPEDRSAFQREEGPADRCMPIVWVNFPPDWERIVDCDWQQALIPIPVPVEPMDFRGVLYGRAFVAGIAERTLERYRTQPHPELQIGWDDISRDESRTAAERAAANAWHLLTVRVHADWLMTPREDLDGQLPRAMLHRDRNWVERELSNRQLQWSRTGTAPRSLDRDTFAYRFGPMGRHEVVMYFELCRHVIQAAWQAIAATPAIDQEALTDTLHERADTWLREAQLDDDPMPPAEIIDKERRREPLTTSQGMLDCDCPICRMQAEGALGSGPCFACFDGHHLELDDEFAFSLYETHDEWEQMQVEFDQFEEFDERMETSSLGQAAWDDRAAAPLASVWQNSFINHDAAQRFATAPLLTMMSLAMRVGEVISDLDKARGHGHLIDRLNSTFDAYRAAGLSDRQSTQIPLCESLEQIAAAIPDLTPKVADLQSQLDEAARHRSDGEVTH